MDRASDSNSSSDDDSSDNDYIPPESPSETKTLNVYPYIDNMGLYRDNNNFIVKQVSPGVVGVIGKHNAETNSIASLTSEEILTAKGIGLVDIVCSYQETNMI